VAKKQQSIEMMNRFSKYLLLTGAVFLAAVAPSSGEPEARDVLGVRITAPGESAVSQRVVLGFNKSLVVDLDQPAADIVITNPEIADAVVQTSKRLIFRGIEYGQTNAFVFDSKGNQIVNLELSVEMDMAGIHEIISRHVPGARVRVEGLNGNAVITGNVASLAESDQVVRLVKAYLGGAEDRFSFFGGGNSQDKIVNLLTINGKEQVLLEVRIVEMQRNVIKQLGINLQGTPGFGDFSQLVEQQLFRDTDGDGIPENLGTTGLVQGGLQTFNTRTSISNGFPIQSRALGGLDASATYTNYVGRNFQTNVGVAINALERIGVVKTLAEPNIVALSGESAKFLAGGEFPVPVAQAQDGAITVEFKPYGVGLAFSPVVLAEDRISLKISTEVSELTSTGAFQGQRINGINDDGQLVDVEGVTIPALSVRRAESTIELPSGGSMMMAGLIQSRSRQNIDQVPGLKKLPVLGSLFQSRDFLSEETELVVIVTPYLVDPAFKGDLRTPADGYAHASDLKTAFLGKLNETYGKDGKKVTSEDYRAPVGFIEE
jgi:pilus assembly protein CpaC